MVLRNHLNGAIRSIGQTKACSNKIDIISGEKWEDMEDIDAKEVVMVVIKHTHNGEIRENTICFTKVQLKHYLNRDQRANPTMAIWQGRGDDSGYGGGPDHWFDEQLVMLPLGDYNVYLTKSAAKKLCGSFAGDDGCNITGETPLVLYQCMRPVPVGNVKGHFAPSSTHGNTVGNVIAADEQDAERVEKRITAVLLHDLIVLHKCDRQNQKEMIDLTGWPPRKSVALALDLAWSKASKKYKEKAMPWRHFVLVMRNILRNGALRHETGAGLTPAQVNELELFVVRTLLDGNADKASFNKRPLIHYASWVGDTTILELVLAAGADVNKVDIHGRTPLFLAAMQQEHEILKLLLAAGADVDTANNRGKSPLDIAESLNDTTTYNLLLNAKLLAVLEHDGLMLENFTEEQQDDKDLVLAAVNQNGLALQYASKDLQDDKEIVLAAVKQNGLALQYAKVHNPEIRLAAVTQNRNARQFYGADDDEETEPYSSEEDSREEDSSVEDSSEEDSSEEDSSEEDSSEELGLD